MRTSERVELESTEADILKLFTITSSDIFQIYVRLHLKPILDQIGTLMLAEERNIYITDQNLDFDYFRSHILCLSRAQQCIEVVM